MACYIFESVEELFEILLKERRFVGKYFTLTNYVVIANCDNWKVDILTSKQKIGSINDLPKVNWYMIFKAYGMF